MLGLSQRVQLYTGAQINNRDLSNSLFDLWLEKSRIVERENDGERLTGSQVRKAGNHLENGGRQTRGSFTKLPQLKKGTERKTKRRLLNSKSNKNAVQTLGIVCKVHAEWRSWLFEHCI
jgi:hypothetical protein